MSLDSASNRIQSIAYHSSRPNRTMRPKGPLRPLHDDVDDDDDGTCKWLRLLPRRIPLLAAAAAGTLARRRARLWTTGRCRCWQPSWQVVALCAAAAAAVAGGAEEGAAMAVGRRAGRRDDGRRTSCHARTDCRARPVAAAGGRVARVCGIWRADFETTPDSHIHTVAFIRFCFVK